MATKINKDEIHSEADRIFREAMALGANNDEDAEIAKKMFALLKKSAKLGHSGAQFSLGASYHKGSGTEVNYKEAAKWYTKAAESGNTMAQTNLSNLYEFGLGVEQNIDKAFELRSKAAEAGDMLAQWHLSECYYNGKGTEINLAKAVEWCNRAAELGCEPALKKLAGHE